jgi:pectinesterase
MPAASKNLSELISNTLAINGVSLATEDNNTQGYFPSWFSGQNRRLLQSTSIAAKANLVVSKSGLGNFRTIQAAIDAASKRMFRTRFIIYVKRGVYRENIVVRVNSNNIWLVGDGLRDTIITSSRSVGAGYTTYSSATAGKKLYLFMLKFIHDNCYPLSFYQVNFSFNIRSNIFSRTKNFD